MQALKGNWIGQTIVQAKYNDSGERRSRIRRSKEERKAMVESFIKKHQVLNSGSFPSLNLTHKEVGGSFYTVREIIREIIQENKVLGPAKLTEGMNQENILEHYPFGSIAIQPELDSFSLDAAENELHKKPNYAYNLSEEHPFNTNLEFDESERWMPAANENISTSSLLMEKHADEKEVNESLEMENILEVSVISEDEANVRESLTMTMDTQVGKNLEKLGAELEDKELEVVVGSGSLLMEKHADEKEVYESLEMENILEVSVISEDEANVRESLTMAMDTQVGKNLEKLGAELEDKELEVVVGSGSLLMEKHADEKEVYEISEMENILEVSVISEDEANARASLTMTMDSQVGKKLEKLGAELEDKELEAVGGSEESSKDGVNILTKEKNFAELVDFEAEVNRRAIEENVLEVRAAKMTSIASDLNVETFPVPVSKTVYERNDITVTPEQDCDEDDEMSFTKSPIPPQDEDTHLEDKNRVHESEEAHLGISNGYAARNDHLVESSSIADHEAKSALHVEIKPISGSDGLNTQTNRSSHEQPFLNEAVNNPQSSYQKITHGEEKENIPTLDRINLESWKGPSKKSPVQLINAPLVFLKAIITTFIKFWTE
ncbi:uncharacterized protein LOC124936867 [Impatiens glandulifera]|uniref:uncharacterized protein LOC124936867 n=1 Tax=Impatiens glandulifera TaxID=253017 RepID=UPI001FB0C749|nr:uncharacterized protein LOC124936867 [Impatiens glandulifera]